MRFVLLATALVGCPRAGPRDGGADALPASLVAWASPPSEVAYERHRAIVDVPLPVASVRQRWLADPQVPGAFDVRTGAIDQGAPEVAQRFVYAGAGLSISAEGAVVDGQPAWVAWEPPMLVLPVDPALGVRWQAEHTHGEARFTRSCELLASDVCAGGLVAVCERENDGFRLVTRDHFCRGQGWSGYESLLVRPAQPAVRTWTEGVRRVP